MTSQKICSILGPSSRHDSITGTRISRVTSRILVFVAVHFKHRSINVSDFLGYWHRKSDTYDDAISRAATHTFRYTSGSRFRLRVLLKLQW